MRTTFTGTIYPSISLTSQNGDVFPESSNFPDVDNYQGTFVEVTSLPTGASVDNIFYFNGSSAGNYFKRVIDGPIRAAQCGVFADGSDVSAQLHAAMNHADFKGIGIPFPGGFFVEGLLIGQAVISVFRNCSVPAGFINPNVEVNVARGTNLLETSSTYGNFSVSIDPKQSGATRYFEKLNNDSSDMVTLMPGDTNLSVTVSGSHDFTFTSARTSSFEVDHLVIGVDPISSATHIMGLVTAINTGTNSVTISYINNDFTNGTYNLFCSYPIYMPQQGHSRSMGMFIIRVHSISPTWLEPRQFMAVPSTTVFFPAIRNCQKARSYLKINSRMLSNLGS